MFKSEVLEATVRIRTKERESTLIPRENFITNRLHNLAKLLKRSCREEDKSMQPLNYWT